MSDLTVYNGQLIAAGLFGEPPFPNTPGKVAIWNGTTWDWLGGGLGGGAYSFAHFNDDLIVGGSQLNVKEPPAEHIVLWNGGGWQPIVTFPKGHNGVAEVCNYNGELVACGGASFSFLQLGNALGRWNGSSWELIGGGTQGSVYHMAAFRDELIIAGSFTSVGGVDVQRIARWNGTVWQSLGIGVNNTVRALLVHDDNLYVGGHFTNAGGQTARRIARWDGSNWHPLSAGFNDTVWSLGVHDGDIIAGGDFTFSGISSNSMLRIARWACREPDCPEDIDEDGVVGVSDLLTVIIAWGPCPVPANCAADLNGDDAVAVNDLLAVITAWGPCP